ncbi:MAG: hypothetical protein AAB074_05460 [Planctomycetota bacterium]
MSFALLIAAHAGLWILAIALQRRLPADSRAAAVAATGVIHAAVAILLALGLGIFGALTPVPMMIAGLSAGALGFALGGARALREAAQATAAVVRDLRSESAAVALLLGAFALLLVVRHLANAWLFVPYTVDEHAYHLPRLVSWVQTGSVARPDMLDLRIYFPASMQVLQSWWVVIPHHDVMVEGAGLEAAFLGAAATAALSRSLGATRAGALLAGLIWACAPIVLVQSCSALNDAAAGAFVLAAAAELAWPKRLDRAVFAASLALLVGAGIKPTVLFTIPALGFLAFLAWKRAKRAEAPAPVAEVPVAPPHCRVTAIALLFIAAIGGFCWFAANVRAFGNPFFPIVPSATGGSQHVGSMPVSMSSGPSFRNMAASTMEIFGSRYVKFDPLITPTADRTGWGFAIALLGPLALGWLVIREKPWRAAAVAFAAGILLTLLLVEHDAFNSRFVLWAAALPAAALGAVASRLPRPWIAFVIVAYASGADLVRTSVPAAFWGRSPDGGAKVDEVFLKAYLNGSWEQRDARRIVLVRLVGAPGGPEEAVRWQGRYDENSPVMCLTAGWPVATLARADFRRRIEFAAPRNASALIDTMRERDCRRLLVWSAPIEVQDAVAQAVLAGQLRLLHTGWYERVGP